MFFSKYGQKKSEFHLNNYDNSAILDVLDWVKKINKNEINKYWRVSWWKNMKMHLYKYLFLIPY